MSLVARASLRYLTRHPWQLVLAVVGVALGVAVVVAIDLANRSALRSFESSQEQLAGRATHRVVGGTQGVPQELAAQLRAAGFVAAPVIESGAVVVVPGGARRALRLLGVDPAAEAELRPDFDLRRLDAACADCSEADRAAALAALRSAGIAPCLLGRALAEELGLELGASFGLEVLGRGGAGMLAAVLDPVESVEAIAVRDLVVTDLASAQGLLDRPGRVTHVDLVLPQGREADVARLLPAGTELVAAAGRSQSLRQMTRAFRLNLTALGLLAAVCGLFLIYNTITFSVVQRRRWLGLLRSLGVGRRALLRMVLGEALVVGGTGTLLGLALGILLAQVLLVPITRTVDDLYAPLALRGLEIRLLPLAAGAVLGVVGSLGAALGPALEATRTPPGTVLLRSQLERRVRSRVPALFSCGLVLVASGVGGLLVGEGLPAAFTALFVAILGSAMLTPAFTLALAAGLAAPLGRVFGGLGRLAARGVAGSLSRTGVAVQALMIAVAVTVGVGLMITSFRVAVESWLGSTLSADLYVRSAETGPARVGVLPEEVVEQLAEETGVARRNTVRQLELGGASPVSLTVLDLDRPSFESFRLRSGSAASAWPRFRDGEGVLVSEPFAYHRGLAVGDVVRLRGDAGEVVFPVLAIYTDYASDRGRVMLSRAGFEPYWGDRRISGVSLFAADGVEPDELLSRVRNRVGERPDVLIESRRALRQASLEVFDRTFAVTRVLRLLVGLVAFTGVLSALMALSLERRRELGVLRANGLTPSQLWRMVTAQTGLLGLAAGLVALPVGSGLAAAMVYVINRRSFGWSMDLALSPGILVQGLLLAVLAALLAGVVPAHRMAGASPAEALRE